MTLQELLEKALEQIKAVSSPKEVPVVKSVEQEERKALFVVLEPDVVDLHNHKYSAKEIEKACISFNVHCNKANLFHRVETQEVVIEQSFIAPSEFSLEDGRAIKKGTWLQWWHFPEDSEVSEMLWKAVKSGDVNGVSIGCRAKISDE